MNVNGIPPEWAGRAFCDRANLNYDAVLATDGDHGVVLRSAVRAGAVLITAHEEPPVDPLIPEAMAFTAARGWAADGPDLPMVKFALAALRRGMELAKDTQP